MLAREGLRPLTRDLRDDRIEQASGGVPVEDLHAIGHEVVGAEAVGQRAHGQLEQLADEDDDAAVALGALEQLDAGRAQRLSEISFVVALMLATLIAAWITTMISRPVSDLQEGMRAIADGDLGHRLTVGPGRSDEFGRLAESYREMATQLRELAKMRAELLSIASHELKTPINVISGYMQLLQEDVYGPLTPEQRRRRPPSVHPIFLTHPITGRMVLYCNPGYATRINELDEAESERVLARLFEHQLDPRYQYTHRWTEGDLLVWDHIGTLHNAIADYGADEHRLMKRCQVMATRVFDPAFLREASQAAA